LTPERFDRYSWFDPAMTSPIDGNVPGYQLRRGLRFTDSDNRRQITGYASARQVQIALRYDF